MRLLILAHYGQQPPYNTMRRYHNWAKELVKRGHEVIIIAASALHNTNIDIIETIGNNTSIVDGVRYIYITTIQYKGNSIGRIINMQQFCRGIKRFSTLKPDTIIISGAYLFGVTKRVYKDIPIITDIPDLWPESIVDYTSFTKRNPLIKYLYYIEKKAYIQSEAVVFSMEGGKDYINEQSYSDKVDKNKIFHVNMGCDLRQKDSELRDCTCELKWNSSDYFNIVYCGSIRIANQVKVICDAAKNIKSRGYEDIMFQIYGNGDDLEMLKQYTSANNLDNVFFYGRIEKEKIPYILSNGRANLLTYRQSKVMKYGGSQSKLFDYLASGRPIICNAKWGYNLIERYECGVIAKNQSPAALADAIESLYLMDEKEIDEMGKRARAVAEKYDQPQIVDQLSKVIRFVNRERT